MTNSVKVTVICLCHNQAPYVQEAIQSVVDQTYRPIELIIVDDASHDGSVEKICQILPQLPTNIELKVLFWRAHVGNCKAFNKALQMATGKYVIDLAADDLLLPERIAQQVKIFENAPEEVGVVFSDAWIGDAQARPLYTFYRRNAQGKLIEQVPSGDVYCQILERYCICAPTMMMRRSVLAALGGYDETLVYEDYDFWVRSARKWKYIFLDQITTIKRKVPRSHGDKIYQWGFSPYRCSTLQVCRKAILLNRTPQENEALARMISYQMRLCLRHFDFDNLEAFYRLLSSTRSVKITDWLIALPALVKKVFKKNNRCKPKAQI